MSAGHRIKFTSPCPRLSEKGKSFLKVIPESPLILQEGKRNRELWGRGCLEDSSGAKKRKDVALSWEIGSSHLCGFRIWNVVFGGI